MSGDRWPDEPDEPSEPEELDPLEDIGPEVPEVEVPEAPDPSENDVDPELARSFWKLVATFNLALFALALGPMLVVFRGEWTNGGAVFLLGVATFFYGHQRYRSVKAGLGDDPDDEANDHESDGRTDLESNDGTVADEGSNGHDRTVGIEERTSDDHNG